MFDQGVGTAMESQVQLGRWLDQQCNPNNPDAQFQSMSELGRACGVSHTTVGRIINGAVPTITTLRKLAEGLGVELEMLTDMAQDAYVHQTMDDLIADKIAESFKRLSEHNQKRVMLFVMELLQDQN